MKFRNDRRELLSTVLQSKPVFLPHFPCMMLFQAILYTYSIGFFCLSVFFTLLTMHECLDSIYFSPFFAFSVGQVPPIEIEVLEHCIRQLPQTQASITDFFQK